MPPAPQLLVRLLLCTALLVLCRNAAAEGVASPEAQRGLHLLLNKAYVPPAFDQQTFDEAWQFWEEPARSQAAAADPDQRRRLAFVRYGLTPRPEDPTKPMQYVVDDAGVWTLNCFGCHQGSAAGVAHPGTPNAQFALETLVNDVRLAKLRQRKKLTDLDIGSMMMPLGTTVGTTNAVMFGVGLMHYRDDDLNIVRKLQPPRMVHHDHDAPPWWNTSRKQRLYIDNFAPRGHRALMQFIASEENGPEKFREWEDDYRHIEAYIDSLEPPPYPFEIDTPLADQGRVVFENHCARCHGTYGPGGEYPELIIPIEEVGTDRVRLDSLTVEHRAGYGRNWINEYGAKGEVVADPGGYLAPPLDGIWATAPYFHNGSVPTLWHVLRPDERPAVWRHPDDPADYDQQRVGLPVETFDELPADTITSFAVQRRYFDTGVTGKDAGGHTFPASLTEDEKRTLLEYLKTL